MANKLDPMDIKQIIRLHLDRYSNREIAETLGIGRNTVNRKIREIVDYGVDMASLLTYDYKALTDLFPTVRRISSDRLERLAAFFNSMNKRLIRQDSPFSFITSSSISRMRILTATRNSCSTTTAFTR
jgi:biotin operon repressor